jgi:two-component system response regulator RegA
MEQYQSTLELYGRMRKILIVDDDTLFRNALAREFRSKGYQVLPAANADEALNAALDDELDLALVDVHLDAESGLDVLDRLHRERPGLLVIMLTGFGTIPLAVEAVQKGAVDFLTKPLTADSILERAHRYLAQHPVERGGRSLARMEWEHIRETLAACNGNVSEAARLLHIHRRSLQRKLRKRPPQA